ncbi:MAG: gfo/Idh/MocA family oxidoreductase [Chitinivibrionales bacterium]|nr:gfo/Idh/MocA family oxidoreductase [Chitinivibrionales bacterium]
MAKQISVGLAGLGGYSNFFLSALLDNMPGNVQFAGAISRNPQRCARLEDLNKRGVKLFTSLEEFYNDLTVDLMIIPSPIQYHVPHTCVALENGSHVLCEKPVCGLVQEIETMKNARETAGKLVAIGYQWSFSRAIQALKKDVLAGVFGAPRVFKSFVLWPRPDKYYHRNNWAGKLQDPSGNWVLDSPVHNATAHFLHNSLYVLGDRTDRSAVPESIEIEAFRAYPIENYDTGVVRCITDTGVTVLHYASHATKERIEPIFEFRFENAVVSFADGKQEIIARFSDGSTRAYGSPMDDPHEKIRQTIDAVLNDKPTLCGIEAATPLTLCVNGGQESITEIADFPPDIIEKKPENDTFFLAVKGLKEMLDGCYKAGVMPSERGYALARKADPVSLVGYSSYPQIR